MKGPHSSPEMVHESVHENVHEKVRENVRENVREFSLYSKSSHGKDFMGTNSA